MKWTGDTEVSILIWGTWSEQVVWLLAVAFFVIISPQETQGLLKKKVVLSGQKEFLTLPNSYQTIPEIHCVLRNKT